MPRQRITKDAILHAAIDLLRREGRSAVTVNRIAKEVGCSVQPIYSVFGSMEGVWDALEQYAVQAVHAKAAKGIDPENMFQSTGQAFVRVAREDPHLFRLFTAARRKNTRCLDDVARTETDRALTEQTAQSLGLSMDAAQNLHLHMLIYTLGLSTLYSVCDPGIEADEVLRQMDAAFAAFAAQAEKERANERTSHL